MGDEKDIVFGISMDSSKAEESIKSFSGTLSDLEKLSNSGIKTSLTGVDSLITKLGNSFDQQASRIRKAADAFDSILTGTKKAESGIISLSEKKIIVPEIVLPKFSDVLKASFADTSSVAKSTAKDIQDAFNRIKIPRPSVSDIKGAIGGYDPLAESRKTLSSNLQKSQFSPAATQAAKDAAEAKRLGSQLQSFEAYKAARAPKSAQASNLPRVIDLGAVTPKGTTANPFQSSTTKPYVAPERVDLGRYVPTTEITRLRGKGRGTSTSAKWAGDWRSAGDIVGLSQEDMSSGPRRLQRDFLRSLTDEQRREYRTQMERLKAGTIAERVRSSRIPLAERQTSFALRGTPLTPMEEFRAQSREADNAEKERKRSEREAAKRKAEQERANRKRESEFSRRLRAGGSEDWADTFNRFFTGGGGEGGPSGRARNLLSTLGGGGGARGGGGIGPMIGGALSTASGAFGYISAGLTALTGAFKVVYSVASTVASTVFTAFKAAFTGIAAIGGIALAGLGATFLGVKKVIDITFEAFNKGKYYANLSDQTGVAIKTIIGLEKAFQAAGMAASDVAPVMASMSRALYVSKVYTGTLSSQSRAGSGVHSLTGGVRGAMMAPTMFKNLGLDPKELDKMGEPKALVAIGRAINNIKDPIDRTAASMAIFRGHGKEMLALFANKGAMSLLEEQLTRTQTLLSSNSFLFREAAERAEKIKMPSLKEGALQVGVGIASQVAGEFLLITEKMKRIDFAWIGEAIGGEIAIGMEAFRTGKTLEYLKDSIITFKSWATEKITSLFNGTMFSPDTKDFASSLAKMASDFGSDLLAALDELSSNVFGMGLSPIINGVVTTGSLLANVFVQVGTMVVSATAQLAQWAEKAYSVVNGFNKSSAKGGAVEGAVAGAAFGTMLGGPAGTIVGGLVGGAYGYVAGGLRNSSGVNTTTSITDNQLDSLNSKMAGLREMTDKLSKSFSDASENFFNTTRSKTGTTTSADEGSAKARRSQLELDKDRANYAALKKSNDELMRTGSFMTEATGVVVGGALRDIGGGGGLYAPMGAESKDSEQIRANTKRMAELLAEINQKWRPNEQGPTLTGMPVGWANINPVKQDELMQLKSIPLSGNKTAEETYNQKAEALKGAYDRAKKINWTTPNAGTPLMDQTDVLMSKFGLNPSTPLVSTSQPSQSVSVGNEESKAQVGLLSSIKNILVDILNASKNSSGSGFTKPIQVGI